MWGVQAASWARGVRVRVRTGRGWMQPWWMGQSESVMTGWRSAGTAQACGGCGERVRLTGVWSDLMTRQAFVTSKS